MMPRIAASFAAVLFWFSLCPAASSAAATDPDYPPQWPDVNITVTLPFPQGSETDALFSLIREGFVAKTGKDAKVRYVPGRAGADAWARVVDDAPDGSVLTLVLFPDAYLRSTQPDSGVFLNTLAVCNVIAYIPCVLWTIEQNPFKTVQDVADAAADKGGAFMVAGSGRYSASQLAARALDREMGVRTTYVPYTGTVTAAGAVVNGQASVFWGYSARVAAPGLKNAKLRPLAVASGKRVPSLPDVPAFQELGMRVNEGVYIGVAVPADTPKITREEISEFFSAFAKTPEFRTKAVESGFSPLDIGMDSVSLFFTEMKAAAERKAESVSLGEQ
ncbi:putative TRAP-T family transporter, periplasmic binding protein [uncultured delta proteobacterium]|uniref:Putative TRAP-T family transporter, periplasmic binding protein n=1 Tax=uncultured delta proteobacterium TaxID=34034 RepID=A0A212JZN5_9DELT|nr:putative TRAP-T family transporter, periplasmic binding protein [uncultured delta proteobacterium]